MVTICSPGSGAWERLWPGTPLELQCQSPRALASIGQARYYSLVSGMIGCVNDLLQLSRPRFEVRIFDALEEFYCAETLEYARVWQQATTDNPVGICGPIGPPSSCRWSLRSSMHSK